MLPAEIIRRAIESRVSDVFTSAPARVVSYDASAQLATIRLTTARPIATDEGDVTHEPYPDIPAVPVCFPRGGGYAITWPLAAGDAVLYVGVTWSPSEWRKGAQDALPADTRHASPGHGVAIPLLGQDAQALESAATSALVVTGADVRLGSKDASDFVALASLVESELQAIKSAMDGLQIVTSIGTGSAVWSVPYTPGDVAATKVKAE